MILTMLVLVKLQKQDMTQEMVCFLLHFFRTEIKSPEAFTILSDRVQALPNVDCTALSVVETRCRVERIDVTINKSSIEDNLVVLTVTDTSNGRSSS
jgi:hypothetical protein